MIFFTDSQKILEFFTLLYNSDMINELQMFVLRSHDFGLSNL